MEKWKEKKKKLAMEQLRKSMLEKGFSQEITEQWAEESEQNFAENTQYDFATCFWAYHHGFLPEYVSKFHVTSENAATFISQAEYHSLHPINGKFGNKLRNQMEIRRLLRDYSQFFPQIYGHITINQEEFLPYIGEEEGTLEDVLTLIRDRKSVIVKSNYYTQKEFFRIFSYEKETYRAGREEIREDDLAALLRERPRSLIITENIKWHPVLEHSLVSRSKLQLILHRKSSAHAMLDMAYLRVNPGKVIPVNVQTGYCDFDPVEEITFQIPHWEFIAAKVEEICSQMPQAKLLQVNVVVTQEGFKIISFEGELSFPQDRVFTSEIVGMLNEKLLVKRANDAEPEADYKNILQVHYARRKDFGREERRAYVEEYFSKFLGYVPNLDKPRTFNEKISWYKLYYENPLVTKCCDKYALKEYVEEKIGREYTVPTIAAYDSPEEVDYDALPRQFALKVNWSSGFNIIVPDKSKLDRGLAKDKLIRWMNPYNNSYYHSFNWGYKNMKPVIYAEQYLEQQDGLVDDYKIFCCNGKAEYLFVATDRFGENRLSYNFYTIDFQPIPCYWGGRTHTQKKLEQPDSYPKMIALAEKLAEPFPFVRVDLYQVSGQIYIGEMTFYSGGGRNRFESEEWDVLLGEKIPIPEKLLTEEK